MRKPKPAPSEEERIDKKLLWFTLAGAVVVYIVLYVIPSGIG